ncbi:MAG: glycosyl hydrolase 115 family protein [Bacteroidales bacterium]
METSHAKLIFRAVMLVLLLRSGAGITAIAGEPVELVSQELISRKLVSQEQTPGAFVLAASGHVAPLFVNGEDFEGVIRAAGDLQNDLRKVTGTEPELITLEEGVLPGPPYTEIILAGTLGKSSAISHLVEAGKLQVDDLKGHWESSVTQIVDDPFPGIDRALVICGSDKRGTIYGIYELSAGAGVSPWYFWADVTPPHRESLYVNNERFLLGEPAVRYRGIFINDEAPALAGWAQEQYGGFNHQFYAHVFELILRMKGNYLWPAMWGRAFYDDDSLNAPLADAYGVVIGTTHHEPLMRAHVEWSRYGEGPWDYTQNPERLREFWREGIRRMDSYKSIISLGMRGDGDMPMTQGTAIELLERIVTDQREIIREETGKPPDEIPQLWALYKEVQEYYEEGMRVPDDVTLLLCDDNWGNLRMLPRPGEPPRQGGYGIYYHFDYVGGPRNYKWLNTNQIERVWEQMDLAYASGVDRIWIVNVGDIKPMELPTQFFLDMAWDPDRFSPENLPDYYRDWAAQQFGDAYAEPVAGILAAYTRFNARRKPELLSPSTYSLDRYREAERVVNEYRALEQKAESYAKEIPLELRDAYYELVLFPVKACANLNDLYVTAALNRRYVEQGRAPANRKADWVESLFLADSLLTETYHRELAGGKWNHMMSQTHIGYTFWQEPPQNNMPEVERIALREASLMGVAIEGSGNAWMAGVGDPEESGNPEESGYPEESRNPEESGYPEESGNPEESGYPEESRNPELPVADPWNGQAYFVEVFNQGNRPFTCTVHPEEPWILPDREILEVREQERIYLSVDWSQVPEGFHTVPVQFRGPEGAVVTVLARLDNRPLPGIEGSSADLQKNDLRKSSRKEDSAKETPPIETVFVPDNGIISIEAASYTNAVDQGEVTWKEVPNLGRTRSGMITLPPTAAPSTPGDGSPHLQYRFVARDTGRIILHAFLSPTLDFYGKGGLEYAVSLDRGDPVRVNMHSPDKPYLWNQWVSDNIIVKETELHISRPGLHTLEWWRIDGAVVLQKLVLTPLDTELDSYLGPPESKRITP